MYPRHLSDGEILPGAIPQINRGRKIGARPLVSHFSRREKWETSGLAPMFLPRAGLTVFAAAPAAGAWASRRCLSGTRRGAGLRLRCPEFIRVFHQLFLPKGHAGAKLFHVCFIGIYLR